MKWRVTGKRKHSSKGGSLKDADKVLMDAPLTFGEAEFLHAVPEGVAADPWTREHEQKWIRR